MKPITLPLPAWDTSPFAYQKLICEMQLLPGRGAPGAAGGPCPALSAGWERMDPSLRPVVAQRVWNKSPHSKLCPVAAGDGHGGLGCAAHAHRAIPNLVINFR